MYQAKLLQVHTLKGLEVGDKLSLEVPGQYNKDVEVEEVKEQSVVIDGTRYYKKSGKAWGTNPFNILDNGLYRHIQPAGEVSGAIEDKEKVLRTLGNLKFQNQKLAEELSEARTQVVFLERVIEYKNKDFFTKLGEATCNLFNKIIGVFS